LAGAPYTKPKKRAAESLNNRPKTIKATRSINRLTRSRRSRVSVGLSFELPTAQKLNNRYAKLPDKIEGNTAVKVKTVLLCST